MTYHISGEEMDNWSLFSNSHIDSQTTFSKEFIKECAVRVLANHRMLRFTA